MKYTTQESNPRLSVSFSKNMAILWVRLHFLSGNSSPWSISTVGEHSQYDHHGQPLKVYYSQSLIVKVERILIEYKDIIFCVYHTTNETW